MSAVDVQQPVAAASAAACDAAAVAADVSYTPLQSGARLLSAGVLQSATLASALARVQSMLPESVSTAAVSQAARVGSLTLAYGQPLAAKLDARLDAAIHALLAAPQQASAKVSAADKYAFEHTPTMLQPTYTRGRALALRAASRAADKAGELKAARVDPLWARVQAKLDSLSVALRDVRAALAESLALASAASRPALLAAQARLAQLQASVSSAVAAAGERVRASQATLTALSHELALQLSNVAQLLEQQLGDKQAAQLRALLASVQTGVAGLKESLAVRIGGSAASSRSNSDASATESDASDASAVHVAAVTPAEHSPVAAAAVPAPAPVALAAPVLVASEASADEHDHEHESSPVADSEGEAGAEEKSASASASRKKGGAKRRKAKRAAAAAQQQAEEQKQKEAAEDE